MSLFTHHKKPSVLFVLRKRGEYWGDYAYTHKSSGLFNSANFVNEMLKSSGIHSHIVEVVDNNAIDKAVVDHNPDVVVLEAIWVTPQKVNELANLWHHKHRKWIIRNHSELPFLALEGISLEWLVAYTNIKNTYISNNSPVANKELALIANIHHGINENHVLLLPNYFPTEQSKEKYIQHKHHLDISCFGAVRPLKNHIEQAIAAMMYAKEVRKPLNFHINATRIECKGDPIIRALRGLFNGLLDFRLIEHGWLDRSDFLKLCEKMDVGLQVSFSETFNIVAADHVVSGVPCVTSDEVPWMPDNYHAIPTDSSDIAKKIHVAVRDGVDKQRKALRNYSNGSKDRWIETLKNLYDLRSM